MKNADIAQRTGGLANFGRMAWAPSYRAPRAEQILKPPPFLIPQAPALPAEEARLLAAVIAAPEADEPRRRIAAWYAAHGNAQRAEFIRQQLDGEATSPDPAWALPFEPWCARDLEYRRGFLEGMSLAGRSFLTLGAALFAMTPLRSVRLVAIGPYLEELIACPHLAKLSVVDLRGNHLSASQLAAVRASPFCTGLIL